MNSVAPHDPDGTAGAGRHHHDAFVSYSSLDKPVADAVVARLEQAGIRCWIAPRDVVPGEIWSESIVGAIADSRLMVVVFSSNANASRQVLREVERAMASNVVVIPLRVESTEPSGALAYFLATEHWLDAITPPLEDHIDKLVHAADTLLGRGESAVQEREPAPSPLAAPAPSARRRSRPRVALIAAGAAAALALVVTTVVLALQTRDGSGDGPPGSGLTRSPSAGVTPAPLPAALRDIVDGDCLQAFVVDDVTTEALVLLACDETHEQEVIYVGNAFVGKVWEADPQYPGANSLEDSGHSFCEAQFASYVGTGWLYSALYLFPFVPDKGAWAAGERWLVCLVSGEKTLDESVKGSGR